MVSGFPHAGRISTTSCGVIVHRQACIHRSGSRFGSAIAFSLYWNRFLSAGSSQCSSSHRSYSSGGPCAGIQRGARPPVDHAMVLVEIRAKHPVLIHPQMQELQPVILVAETRIPSVGARMRPALRIDPAGPRPQWGRVRVRSRHALVFHDFLGRVPRPLWSWVNAFPFH